MNYNVSSISVFDKEAKRLCKKYPSLKNDLSELIESLGANPQQGKALGNNFYKIRLSITSKGKGKSGGARVITFVKIVKTTVYLSSIYDKSEKITISDDDLDKILNLIPE